MLLWFLLYVLPTSVRGGAFVHLFEWSWSDIAQECEDFLGPHKFSAIQVSPPQEDIQGSQWWTRYQPVSYALSSRSGSKSDFENAVSRCKKVGVDIYVDAVINHMAAGSGTGTSGSSFGGRNFPGTYSPNDFHHNSGDNSRNCDVTFNSRSNIQQCDLLGLPDLDQGSSYTQSTIKNYLASLKNLGVAGIRVDAAKHIDAGQLGAIVSNSGLFAYCEVDQDQFVQGREYYSFCKITEFNVGRNLGGNFKSGTFQDLSTFGTSAWGLQPSDDVITFIDNHDTQRSGTPLTYKNGDLYRLATTFLLAHPYGYPKVMSSYYFSDSDQGPPSQRVHSGGSLRCQDGRNWVCEHRWKGIGNMATFRHFCDADPLANFYAPSSNHVAFSRGSCGFVAINRDGGSWGATVQTGLPAGAYTDLINGGSVTVDGSGNANLNVPPMDAVAIGTFQKAAPLLWNATAGQQQ